MAEGGCGVALVLQRLAEREMEMKLVLFGQIGRGERRLHRGDVRRVEADGLQVGEAPPDLAEAGLAGRVRGDRR